MQAVLRRPLLAICVVLTALTGLAGIGLGAATLVANSRLFGVGVAAVLVAYGAGLVLIAWLVVRRVSWALGLVVASSLLHLMVVGSFLTTTDRAQFIGSLIVAPFVLATVVTAVLAVGRRELERLG
ncbi:hypothetical protein [Tessaracoccus sp. Z1128]